MVRTAIGLVFVMFLAESALAQGIAPVGLGAAGAIGAAGAAGAAGIGALPSIQRPDDLNRNTVVLPPPPPPPGAELEVHPHPHLCTDREKLEGKC